MIEKEKLEKELEEYIYDLECTKRNLNDRNTHHTELPGLRTDALCDIKKINELKEKIKELEELEEKLAEYSDDLDYSEEKYDNKNTPDIEKSELRNDALYDIKKINELKEKIKKIAESDNDYSKSR